MGRFVAPDFDGHNVSELEVQGARARGSGWASSRFRVGELEVQDPRGLGCARFKESQV